MKKKFQRLLALLLCVLMLSAFLPRSFAEEVEFAALAEAGERKHYHFSIRTEPQFYVAAGRCDGNYIVYYNAETGASGIADLDGRILYESDTAGMYIEKVLASNLFIAWIGEPYDPGAKRFLCDFSGRRVLEELSFSAGSPSVSVLDRITGKLAAFASDDALYLLGDYHGLTCSRTMIRPDGTQAEVWDAVSEPWNGNVTYMTLASGAEKWGAKTLFGPELLPAEYDFLAFVSEDTLVCAKSGRYGLIRLDGSEITAMEYEDAAILPPADYPGELLLCKAGKWGVLDTQGQVVIPFAYDALRTSSGYPGFRFRGTVGDTTYALSEDPELRFCGSRRFPDMTLRLSEGVYLISTRHEDWTMEYRVVNDQNEALIDGSFAACSRSADRLALSQPELGKTILCDTNAQCIAVVDRPELRFFGEALIAAGQDEAGQRSVEFYSQDGALLKTYDHMTAEGFDACAVCLQNDEGLWALAAADGTLRTEFRYSYLARPDASELSVHLFIGQLPEGGAEWIDSATGKNLLPEGYRLGANIYTLGPDQYFAIYSEDARIGVAVISESITAAFRDVKASAWYAQAVSFCYNAGLMKGEGAGKFSPNASMTRAMVVQVLYNLSGEKTASYGFTDVPKGKWYTKAVNWAAAKGYVNGTSKTTFSPNDPVTREQVVTILYRYAQDFGAEAGDLSVLDKFDDRAQVSKYARPALAWAVSEGIIKGATKTTINPKGTATRAEIATMLMRFVQAMAQK